MILGTLGSGNRQIAYVHGWSMVRVCSEQVVVMSGGGCVGSMELGCWGGLGVDVALSLI